MKNITKTVLFIFGIFVFFSSCIKEKNLTKKEGVLKFEVNIDKLEKSVKAENIHSIIITVKDLDGNIIYDRKQLELLDFNGYLISSPIYLSVGEYQLTEFFVTNSENEIIYATPLAGSDLSQYVARPLPFGFNIEKDLVEKITPQVISVENNNPIDFGYATFGLEIVELEEFLLAVFVYNKELKFRSC